MTKIEVLRAGDKVPVQAKPDVFAQVRALVDTHGGGGVLVDGRPAQEFLQANTAQAPTVKKKSRRKPAAKK